MGRNLSLLLAVEGCRFPSIHALHAANMEPVRWFCGRYFSVVPFHFFPTGVFSLPPVCRNLSLLLAVEGCRFPSIHALHAANMEPVRWLCGRYFLVVPFYFFPTGVFSLPPVCRNHSLLLAVEGCRFPSIHVLHAANMEPVRWFCGRYFSLVP